MAGSLSAPHGATVTWGRTDGATPMGVTADPGWACAAFACHQNGAVPGIGLLAVGQPGPEGVAVKSRSAELAGQEVRA